MNRNDTAPADGLPAPVELTGPAGQVPFTPGEIAGITAPLIGRDAELQQLIGELYASIEGGPARLITIVGPAGIGKSRLAHEFREVAARLPEPVTLIALQADRESTGRPYSLFRLLVAALFRIRESELPTAGARLEQGVAHLLGPGNEEKAHFIGQLAGYDFSGSPYLRGSPGEPRQIRDRGLHYAAQCVQALSAQAPLVLLLDDFHNADDSSIDAVASLFGATPAMNLLAVCLSQPRLYERRPEWDAEANGRGARLDLRPLDERAGRSLVAAILRKAGKLPPDLRNLIVSRAEGNPFYVEELIKMLIADGVIVPGAAAWTVQQGRLSRLRIPATLGELLRARVQSLSPAERGLLLRAAVVGRVFWADAALALGGEESAAEAALADLEAKDLIAPGGESRFAGQREYAFRHELLHEVAYTQVPPEQRAAYHGQTAGWLIEHSGERAPAYAALIAEHYERGGCPEQAAHWFIVAGHHARETYAVDTAISRYQTALAMLAPAPSAYAERVGCYEGLGKAQQAVARIGEAVASFGLMASLAEATGDRATEARAWMLHAEALDDAVEYGLALESARRAVALAEAAGDRRQLGHGLRQLAFAEMRFEHHESALPLAERALALLAESGDDEGLVLSKGLLGLLAEARGDYTTAMAHLGDAVSHLRAAGNLHDAALQLNNLGYLANSWGDYAAAAASLGESMALCREIGSRVGEIYVLSNLGFALNGLGDYATAEAESRRGIEMSELSRMPVFSDFYRALAEAHLGQGRPTEALEAGQQALDMARKSEGPREVAGAWRVIGRAMSAMSDSQGAPACFAESARLLNGLGAQGELGRTLRDWAVHELRRGDRERGRSLWVQARATFAAAGMALELERTPVEGPEG